MNNQNLQSKPASTIRSVREVMDEVLMKEFIANGMSEYDARQEIEESRRMADRHDELLAMGYTVEEIDTSLQGMTSQEILARTISNGVSPQRRKAVSKRKKKMEAELQEV